jgi:hypothetical protein
MKFSACLIFGLFVLSCSSESVSKRAISYNDAIVLEQNNIVSRIVDMSNALSDPNLSEKYRINIVKQCDESIAIVSKMEPFEGDATMRDAALDLFGFYREIAANEFKVILEVYVLPELSEQDYNRLYMLEAEISKREEPYDLAFKKAQKAFSEKYKLSLQRNEKQDLVDGK